MKDEIFGPILPIVPYRKLEDAVAYVNARPRPLQGNRTTLKIKGLQLKQNSTFSL
jgi:acyl-CoA reductase-like NAD-dependent aldehyde dehydrogenase